MIQITNLTKSFGKKTVLQQLSLDIADNEIVIVVGNNGSGKTTLFNLIMHYVSPTAGSIIINGQDVSKSYVVSKHVLLSDEKNQYLGNNTLSDIVQMHADMADGFDADKCLEIMRRFRLSDKEKYPKCSKGMKQQFNIAIALASDADILLLDEPTSGLDELSRYLFMEIIREEYMRRPRTFMISTHLLGELENLATHLLAVRENGTCVYASHDEMEAYFVRVSGLQQDLLPWIMQREAFQYKEIGVHANAIVRNELSHADKKYLREHNIDIESVHLAEAARIICNEEVFRRV